MPVAPQAVVATAIGAQAIFLSWNQADFRASTGLYYIQPIGLPSASSTFTNYTLRGLNLNKKYTISVCDYENSYGYNRTVLCMCGLGGVQGLGCNVWSIGMGCWCGCEV